MGTTQTFLTGEAVRTVLRSSPGVGWRRYWSRGAANGSGAACGPEGRASRVEPRQTEGELAPRGSSSLFPPPCPREGSRRRAAYGAHGRRRESAARMEVAGARGARGGHLEPGGWRRTRRRAGAGRPVHAEASGSQATGGVRG